MQRFCKSVDIFQKICKGFSRICPALGHEIEKNVISIGIPFSSHVMTAPLTNTIAISMTQSGVIITAGGSLSGVAGSASDGSVGPVSGVAGSASAGSIGSVSGVAGSASAGSIGSVSGVAGSASAGSNGSVSGVAGSASAVSVGSVSGVASSASAGSNGSVSGVAGSASAGSIGSVSGVASSASAGSNGSVSGVAGSASAGSIGSVSGVASSASAGSVGSVSGVVGSASGIVGSVSAASNNVSGIAGSASAGSVGSASAGSVSSVSGIIASASAGAMSMTWPSIVTSAFGSMIATISPSAHSHVLMSSFAHSGKPWSSSYNISERMEWWLHYIKNNTDCKHGEKFCGLKLECIPDDEKCTVHLTNDMMYNLSNTAWCVNCSSNKYFCPLFMQCIDVNESCSYHRVHQWINSGNMSDELDFDLACSLNETFSFVTMKCESKGPLRGSKEHTCPHDEVLCPYSVSCRNKTDCDPSPALNFSKALDNDTFGKNDTLVLYLQEF